MGRQYEQDFFFKAAPERLWQALTLQEELTRWMGTEVIIEPRVGGRLDVKGIYPGVIQEFDPPRRMVWTWGPADGSEPVTETVTLHPENGGTRLHLHVVVQTRWAEDPIGFGGFLAGARKNMADLRNWIERGQPADTRPHGLLNATLGADAGGSPIFFRQLADGGVAAAAGIQAGDRLVAWDGRPVDSPETFWNLIWATVLGQRIHLDLERDGRAISAELTMAAPKA